MKKIIFAILGVAVLIAGTFFLAFTEIGNKMILPYVDSHVKERYQSVDA